MARRYALIIGISQYKSPLKPLSKTVTDAEAVAAIFRAQGAFQEIAVLTGEVTSTRLIEALRRLLLEQAKGNDALLYFTGHGIPVLDSLMGEPKGYLATSDCVVTLQGQQVVEQQRGIAIASLNDLIRASELSSLVMLLDCCHSGGFLERQVVERTLTAFSGRQDYYLITACRGFEQAYAKKREQHSIFTGALLEGLSEQQADEDGNVTGDSLSAFIKRELRGSGQEPISMGIGGAVTLVSYRKQIAATQIDEKCPYQGLEPFTEATQQFFFGRKPVVEMLRQELERSPFVALIGASGSGKSSVVRAGLIPWLRELGWRVLDPIKPGFEPLGELKRTFANQFRRRDEIQQVYEAIASGSLDTVVALMPGMERMLLVVDQFEELFTVCSDEEERQSLINLLTQFQNSRLAVVITMRADFLEPCLAYANLTQQLQQHTVLIPPLEGKALEEAIASPAYKQGYSVEPALLRIIQRDVAQEKNCLPLLQFALQSLWDSANQADHQLTLDNYEQLQGIAGALNRHADRVYEFQDWREATPTQPRSAQEQDWIKRLCLKLVRTGESNRDTRQRQTKADLLALASEGDGTRAIAETVLSDLVDARLLVTNQEETTFAYVDLAHEALMDGWKRFAEWREGDRDARRLIDRMEDARREWEHHQRNPDFLLSRGLSVQIELQSEHLQPYLTSALREFYQLSKDKEREQASAVQWARSEGALDTRAQEAIELLQQNPLDGLALVLQLVKLNLEETNNHLFSSIQRALYQAVELARECYCFEGHEAAVRAVAMSPDGTRIISGSADHTIRTWSLDGTPIGQPFREDLSSINSVAFSTDGKLICSGGVNKTIRLWSLDGTPIGKPFVGHQDYVWSVAFSPDGQIIASGSSDNTIRLWKLDGTSIGQPLVGHKDAVRTVAFSPDGSMLISGSNNGLLLLWKLDSTPIGQPLVGHRGSVRSVAFSPNGRIIASGGQDQTIRLWDLNGTPIGEPFQAHQDEIWSVTFSPDGKIIASGSQDQTIRLWSLDGEPITQPLRGHQSAVRSVAFTPDGRRLISGSKDNTIRLWSLDDILPEQLIAGHQGAVYSVAFSPNGRTIASGSEDTTVRLWDLQGNPLGQPFVGHENRVYSVAFSPDGKTVISGSRDGTIRLWNLKGNLIGHPFEESRTCNFIYSVAFSPDGKTIVSGSERATIRLWDLQGKAIGQEFGQPFDKHQDTVCSIAFSPDGRRIVSGSLDHLVQLWNLQGQAIWKTFVGHEYPVMSVAFSSDGKIIASGGQDNIIRLWTLDGDPLGEPLVGHNDWVLSIGFSPNGKQIVSSSADNTIRLWDLRTNSTIKSFRGHEGSVYSVAFSPDGKTIISGGEDTTIYLWRIGDWKDWLAICCNRIRCHPYMQNPQTEESELICEICEKYVWSQKENVT
ncbi:caspase family protein [Leptolyngbya sp. PL-A3]|uniref:nSTAND1 domain-containing NTPase n=1 Tax=Leptolyngbya sp. PL-A3 TaxID=2933911 RepID=UPI003298FF9A